MAYLINATNSGLRHTSFAIGSAPLTFACWFSAATVTSLGRLMTAADAGTSTNYWALLNRGDVASDPVEWQVDGGGTSVNTRTSAGFSADTWTHALGVDIASNSREVYINAGSVGTNATDFSPSGIDNFGIGMTTISIGTFYSGHNLTVAEAAIWNVALGADERAALAAGFSPMLIRPTNLISYWPLGGLYGNHFRDIVGGYNLTQVGTVTAAEHPRIIYPGGALVIPKATVVATPWLYRTRHSQIIGGGVL